MYSEESGDNMVECPYDKCHRMLRKNLQKHLLKCKLNYPNVELQTCPFDKIHLVKEEDYVNHVNNCPARSLIFRNEQIVPKFKVEAEDNVKHEPIECEENWDDTEVEDYKPLKKGQTSILKRRPISSICYDSPKIKKRIKNENYENERLNDHDPNVLEGKKDDFYDNEEDKPKPASQETVGIYCFIDERPDSELFSSIKNLDHHSLYDDRGSSPPPPPPRISNYVPNQGTRKKCSRSSVSYVSNARESNRYNFSERRENLRIDKQFDCYENLYSNGQDARQVRRLHTNNRLTSAYNPHYSKPSQHSTQRYFRGNYHNMNSYHSSQ